MSLLLADAQGVTAIALDTGAGLQLRLAVAVRTSKRSVRLLVYEIVPGVGLGTQMHSQPAICLTQAELVEPLYVKVGDRMTEPCTQRHMELKMSKSGTGNVHRQGGR